MTIRRADLRFALPAPVRRATVLGLPEWREALTLAGIAVVDGSSAADLAVAPTSRAGEAARSGTPMIVLEGRTATRLRLDGFRIRRYLPLPGLSDPDLVLPLERDTPADYALLRWRPAEARLKRARNRAVAALVRAGAVAPLRPLGFAAAREDGPPFLISAAAALGVPADARWFMTLGQGDVLTRAAFHLFPRGSSDPAWVLKFARVPGHDEPFVRDEQGLRLAQEAGDVVARHAPHLVGRLEAHGLPLSVETAAIGERLSTLLRRTEATEQIERVAGWLVEVGRSTAGPSAELGPERRRLAEEVLPSWPGVPADLVARLPPLPGVLQHNDVGSWNIVVGEDGFVVLDWESARRPGLPLWDLLYFLVDALPLVEGARTPAERADRAMALLRGASVWSPMLFDWLRKAAAAAAMPPAAIGPVATLCWLHHGLSHVTRGRAATGIEPGASVSIPPVERIAAGWLADPALGPDWSPGRD